MRDLLRSTKTKAVDLKILNDTVSGANTPAIDNFDDVMSMLRKGLANRETDATGANDVSSRYE